MILEDLAEGRLERSPSDYAQYIAHLLKGTVPPFYDCWSLREVVELMKSQSPAPDTADILEQALRLGCLDAPAW